MEFIIFAILILLAIGTLVYGIGVLVLGGWPYCAAIALAGIIVAIIGAVSAKKIKDGTTHEHEEYINAHNADKEALNLYDREERERAEHLANNQILWQMQQQAQEDRRKALERMEEEQRRHNDAMRESEKKRNEKIDEAIRDMKDSLRQ